MGNWGIKALESDERLDIIELFKAFVETHPDVKLKELIAYYIAEGFLSADNTQIDYLYDKTTTGLTEIYFEYRDNGQVIAGDKPLSIASFTAGKNDLHFLQQHINDIINETPDEDGEREYAELYKESPGWTAHMQQLSERLSSEYQKLADSLT